MDFNPSSIKFCVKQDAGDSWWCGSSENIKDEILNSQNSL